MSLSKIIARLKERENSGGVKTLSEHFFDEVKNSAPFSYREALRRTNKLMSSLEDADIKAALYHFAFLYEILATARPRTEHVFHPSSLEKDCPRKLWYDLNKTPRTDKVYRDITPQLQVTFDLGTWFHLYTQIKLLKAGVLKEFEVPIRDNDWKIDGHMDGLVNTVDFDNDEFDDGLEIKTMNSNMYRKSNYGVFETHKKQAFLYATFKKPTPLKRVQFKYFNKDTSESRTFIEEVDPAIVDPMKRKMNEVLTAKDPLPRICGNVSCTTALECPFRTHCFKSKY